MWEYNGCGLKPQSESEGFKFSLLQPMIHKSFGLS
jgi:hypothetical protein